MGRLILVYSLQAKEWATNVPEEGKAAGVSSNANDSFAVEDAVLVNWPQIDVEYDEANAPVN